MSTKAKGGPGRVSVPGRTGRSGGDPKQPERAVSDRYTPPVPKSVKKSPAWMGVLILALFGLGVVLIIVNYVGLLPGGVNNVWLIPGIALIFAGLMVATRYH